MPIHLDKSLDYWYNNRQKATEHGVMCMDMQGIGQRVRMCRRALHLTQAEVAEKIGVSGSFLGHIERGMREPSMETLVNLCQVLNISPNELLGLEYAEMSAELPEQVTVSVPSLLQGMADLLKNLQIPE